ncbi:hypothetical protein D3C78_551910 [compost metagenome]
MRRPQVGRIEEQLEVSHEHIALAGRQVRPANRESPDDRRPGTGAPAPDAASARPHRRPRHRRLHLRLPWFAAGRLRPGAVEGPRPPQAEPRQVPAGGQRGPRSHLAMGHPAGQPVPRRQVRRRVRHVVRQRPRRGPLRRRVPPRQRRRHLEVRRCAGYRRR